jgi:hypothetical protein
MEQQSLTRHVDLATFLLVCFVAVPMRARESAESTGQFYQLNSPPTTAVWGYYDAKTPPVLRIRSGDTIEVHTLVTRSPEGFASARVQPDQIEQPLLGIFKKVERQGAGPHDFPHTCQMARA